MTTTRRIGLVSIPVAFMLIALIGLAASVSLGLRQGSDRRLIESMAREKQLLAVVKDWQSIAARWEKLTIDSIATAKYLDSLADERKNSIDVCRSMLPKELRERF